jgi:hypothetical protein
LWCIRHLDVLKVILTNSMDGKSICEVYQHSVGESASDACVQTPRANENITAPVAMFLKRYGRRALIRAALWR